MSYDRAIGNRKLHVLLGQLARKSGGDVEALKQDFVAQVSREHRGPGLQTVHSSELTDLEHERLVRRVSGIADRAGVQDVRKPQVSGPKPQTQQRLPKGVSRMRTREQEAVLRKLVERLFKRDLAGGQGVFNAVLKECPDSASARAKIDELKSRLVREADLSMRADRLLHLPSFAAGMTTRDKNVCFSVASAKGRKINSLRVGAVLWVYDLVERGGVAI